MNGILNLNWLSVAILVFIVIWTIREVAKKNPLNSLDQNGKEESAKQKTLWKVGMFSKEAVSKKMGWLIALAGQGFALYIISEVFPEFWKSWKATPGFWPVQSGFFASAVFKKYGKPKIVSTIIILLTVFCLVITVIRGCQDCGRLSSAARTTEEMKAAKAAERWRMEEAKKNVSSEMVTKVVAPVNGVSEEVRIPFGKIAKMEFEGGSVWLYKNGRLWTKGKVDGASGNLGNDWQRIAFQSAESHEVLVTIRFDSKP
jgi:membrane-bound metal-dependent hydrolase YbcI (DUF457 family)